jgi:hypothetical protein
MKCGEIGHFSCQAMDGIEKVMMRYDILPEQKY